MVLYRPAAPSIIRPERWMLQQAQQQQGMMPGFGAAAGFMAGGGEAILGFKSAGSLLAGTGNGITQPLPASWSPGDIFVFFLGLNFNYASNTPTGWTLVSNSSPQSSCRLKFFYRVAQAGDAGPVMNETSGAGDFSSSGYLGAIVAYTGLATRANDDSTNSNTSGTTLAYGTTASSINNSVAVAAFYKNVSTTAAPGAGWTARVSGNNASNRTLTIVDAPLPTSGTGPPAVNQTFGSATGETLLTQCNLRP